MVQKPKGNIAFVYFDGACEYSHATWAWVAFGPTHEQLGYAYGHIDSKGAEVTANIAEYYALNEALRFLKDETIVTRVVMRSDCQLVIRQMTGEYVCRSPKLVPHFHEARRLMMSVDVRFEWVSKERNAIADAYTIAAFPSDIQAIISEKGRMYERR